MKSYHIIKIILILSGLFILTGCGNTDNSKTYTGIVEGKTFTVSTPVSDKLIELVVDEGAKIRQNQFLALIDTTDTHLQKTALVNSLEQLSWQRKELEIRHGQMMDAYRHAKDKYEKNLSLLHKQAVSDQLVLDLKLQVDKWGKEKLSLEANKNGIISGMKQLNQQIEILSNKIKKARLSSPAGGFVEKIYYEIGEYVAPMSPVLDIVNLDEIWCYIYVSETQLASIQPGQKVKGQLANSDFSFEGRVMHINQKAEFTPKEILTPDNRQALVYAVKIQFINKKNILKSGMPVEISL